MITLRPPLRKRFLKKPGNLWHQESEKGFTELSAKDGSSPVGKPYGKILESIFHCVNFFPIIVVVQIEILGRRVLSI